MPSPQIVVHFIDEVIKYLPGDTNIELKFINTNLPNNPDHCWLGKYWNRRFSRIVLHEKKVFHIAFNAAFKHHVCFLSTL